MFLSLKLQKRSHYGPSAFAMALISSQTPFDLDLGLRGTHVLVTGGCGLIGKVVAHAFLAAGCNVTVIDITKTSPFNIADQHILYVEADITRPVELSFAFTAAEEKFGPVATCIALASIDLYNCEQTETLADADPETWQLVFDVNIHGTFLTCQHWLRSIRRAAADPSIAANLRNVGLIIMGSEAGRFGVRTMAAYAAGKAAVQYGLLSSLVQDAPRLFAGARVNAVAPGAVDTERWREEVESKGPEWYWREGEAT